MKRAQHLEKFHEVELKEQELGRCLGKFHEAELKEWELESLLLSSSHSSLILWSVRITLTSVISQFGLVQGCRVVKSRRVFCLLACLFKQKVEFHTGGIKLKAMEGSTVKSITLPSLGCGGELALQEQELGSSKWEQLCSHEVVLVMWFCDTAPMVLSS